MSNDLGWDRPETARKLHWFVRDSPWAVALCGKYRHLVLGDARWSFRNDVSAFVWAGRCKACEKKLEKRADGVAQVDDRSDP